MKRYWLSLVSLAGVIVAGVIVAVGLAQVESGAEARVADCFSQ